MNKNFENMKIGSFKKFTIGVVVGWAIARIRMDAKQTRCRQINLIVFWA